VQSDIVIVITVRILSPENRVSSRLGIWRQWNKGTKVTYRSGREQPIIGQVLPHTCCMNTNISRKQKKWVNQDIWNTK